VRSIRGQTTKGDIVGNTNFKVLRVSCVAEPSLVIIRGFPLARSSVWGSNTIELDEF
jgi:hypothetical protein